MFARSSLQRDDGAHLCSRCSSIPLHPDKPPKARVESGWDSDSIPNFKLGPLIDIQERSKSCAFCRLVIIASRHLRTKDGFTQTAFESPWVSKCHIWPGTTEIWDSMTYACITMVHLYALYKTSKTGAQSRSWESYRSESGRGGPRPEVVDYL
jgi:hypothetical protein